MVLRLRARGSAIVGSAKSAAVSSTNMEDDAGVRQVVQVQGVSLVGWCCCLVVGMVENAGLGKLGGGW